MLNLKISRQKVCGLKEKLYFCSRNEERRRIFSLKRKKRHCNRKIFQRIFYTAATVRFRRESPVNIACKVVETRPLGSHTMFIAEVVGVTIDDAHMDETGRFHINETGLVMYSHGEYFLMGEKLGKFGYSIQKNK